MASQPVEIVACPDCDLMQRIPELAPGSKARCGRCGHILASQSADPLDRPLALTLAAAIVFIVANTASLMGLSAVGRFASTTIPNGAYEMWLQDQKITAVIVAFCAVIAPGAYILFMLTLLLAIRRPPAPHWVGELLRWGNTMQPWSMGEVMILGIMVALIKIAELASVADYRVAIQVQTFDSAPGDAATLDAVWTVSRSRDGKSQTGRTAVREVAPQGGFDGVAAAHSRALARLSRDIADAVQVLARSGQ